MFADKKLLHFFDNASQQQLDLVAVSVIGTEGSTYRKSGALMLIDSQQNSCGLISGGCFENDLMFYAKEILEANCGKRLQYDLRGDDEVVWGLGLGCNGLVDLWLQPFYANEQYGALEAARNAILHDQPSDRPHWLVRHLHEQQHHHFGVIADKTLWHDINEQQQQAIHQQLPSTSRAIQTEIDGQPFFLEPIQSPSHLLILGAGADCIPLVEIANTLGWQVTVCDHRQGYLDRITGADRCIKTRPEELSEKLPLEQIDAAVVMSHHFESDAAYLQQLAKTSIRYLGVLGPKARTEQLTADRPDALTNVIKERLYNPIGLDLGGESPQSIALSICAEITAVLSGKNSAGFLRDKSSGIHDE